MHSTDYPPEKPWAILGVSRKQYAAARPWKKVGMTKEKYAEMLNLIPHEAVKLLKDAVDAERLVEEIFVYKSSANSIGQQ